MTTKRWTLSVVCVATAMLMLDIAVVNTALSRIAEDLGTGLSGLQWVVDAYTLALASVVLTAGSLADRFGRRRLFTGGLALFTLASAACAASPSIEALVAARAASRTPMLPASAQASEAAVKTAMPTVNTRRRPSRSETEPAVRTTDASATV